MQKVLLLTHTFPYGSGEEFIRPELEALAECSELHIFPTSRVAGRRRRVPQQATVHAPMAEMSKWRWLLRSLLSLNLFSLLADLGVELRHSVRRGGSFNVVQRAVRVMRLHQGAARVRSAMRRSRISPEDCVCFSYWGSSGALALAINRRANFVVRLHGGDLYSYRSRVSYAVQRRIVDRAHLVLAVSDDGTQHIQDRFPSEAQKVKTLRLGVAPQAPAAWWPARALRICSIAFVTPVKRLDHLLRAVALVHQKGIAVEWTHIGDGPGLPLLKAEAKRLGLVERVQWIGHLPGGEDGLYPFLRSRPFDAAVSISQSEGIPVSLMECASFGIPLIATNVGGTAELVRPECGRLLPAEAGEDEIASALIDFARIQEDEHQRMRAAARATQITNFHAQVQSTQLLEALSLLPSRMEADDVPSAG